MSEIKCECKELEIAYSSPFESRKALTGREFDALYWLIEDKRMGQFERLLVTQSGLEQHLQLKL
jgi:hypothetical protein